MSRIKATNTTPERTLFSALKREGVYFAKHVPGLPGRPDIVFRKLGLIVFVDGTFWHGWRFPAWEKSLKPYWKKKIAGNRARDRRNFAKLRRQGWVVLRLWEHDITRDLEKCLSRIRAALSDLQKKAIKQEKRNQRRKARSQRQ